MPVPFHNLVDPDGVLANMANDNLMHCEDNEVSYYKHTTDRIEGNEV